MRDHNLDVLVRFIASDSSRRGVLQSLLSGAVAAILGREAAAACVKAGKRCGKGKTCCRGLKCKRRKCRGAGYIFVTAWGSQGTGNGQFNLPQDVEVDGAGNVYVVDTENHRIQ